MVKLTRLLNSNFVSHSKYLRPLYLYCISFILCGRKTQGYFYEAEIHFHFKSEKVYLNINCIVV